jgi:acyl-CoA synthetase (NDP forming)
VGISLRQRRTLWETTVNTFHDPDILAQALLANARRLTRCRAQSGRTNAGEAHMDESRAARVQQALSEARATLARSRASDELRERRRK